MTSTTLQFACKLKYHTSPHEAGAGKSWSIESCESLSPPVSWQWSLQPGGEGDNHAASVVARRLWSLNLMERPCSSTILVQNVDQILG
jgi:hypothetical protein